MKVTLINPPVGYVASRWENGILPSLGLGYLAAYLEANGVACEILDAQALNMRPTDIRRHLSDSPPDVVGITFTTENRFAAFETIRAARAGAPKATVVAGGPHVSAAAEDTLSHIPDLDLVIRGEGEHALLELVRRLESGESIENTPSLTYRREGGVVSNPRAELIRDLDSLPFPARHLMPMDEYQHFVDVPGVGRLRSLNIMASRGCPFDCSFCASPTMWGRRFRARSPENVLAEVDELVCRYGAQALWIFDDTFTVDRARTVAICEGLFQRFHGIRWTCEIRVDTVDRELLKLMKEAGCYCVAFGVESGSQRVLDESVGKRIRLEQVREVISWCRDIGLPYNPFMILSHPGETEEDARQSMQLVREWKQDGASVSLAVMHVYPGTRIETLAREKGVMPKDFSWSLKSDARRVPMLPAAQGDVPIFIDRLSWSFLAQCLVEWAGMQQYSILKRIPKAIRSVRSLSDLGRCCAIAKTCLLNKLSSIRPARRIPADDGWV